MQTRANVRARPPAQRSAARPVRAAATAPERSLAALGARLNGGAVVQRTVAYDHDRKLYYNDESQEPPPGGYIQVDSNAFNNGLGGRWTTSPPMHSGASGYMMNQMVLAIESGDIPRQQQLQSFVQNTLGQDESTVFDWTLENRLEDRRMEREAPDDSGYYLGLIDLEDPTPSEYVTGLMVKGIPGAGKLLEQYETSTGGSQYGFEKQIEVTRRIEQERGLRAVEQNQSDITPRNVFVSADIVTSNREGKDVLVEVKYWPGLETWPKEKQSQMARQLFDQLMRYVSTGKEVELHWLAALPDWLRGWLDEIARRSFGKLKIVTG